MMENRSFDHFLGALKSDAGYAGKAQVEGLTGTESNPAPDGTPVTVFKMDELHAGGSAARLGRGATRSSTRARTTAS